MENLGTKPRVAKATSYAEQACAADGLDFAETFAGQFVFSHFPVSVPQDWVTQDILGCYVSTAPDLPFTTVSGPSGEPHGVVIGLAVSKDGEFLKETVVAPNGDDLLEEWALGLAGRYVVILRLSKGLTLYCDPSNSLVTFYNPATKRAGTSIPLLIDDAPDHRFENESVPAGTFLLFGDTMDRRVSRMLSNHALDLSSFETRRVWPRHDTIIDPPKDYSSHLDGMVARQTQILKALIGERRVIFPITGGTDSRFLFACLQSHKSAISGYYVHVQNQASFLDSLIATAVCERAGVPLTTMSLSTSFAPQGEELDRIRHMVQLSGSFQVPDQADTISAACLPRRLGDTLFRGGLIEMTRANKWTPEVGDTPNVAVAPDVGMRSMAIGTSIDEDFVLSNTNRYAAWLDTLPEHLRGRAIDFAHCELWVPTTNHVFYNALAKPFMMNPFSDRQLVLDTARMTYRFRSKFRPQNYVIREYAPDLRRLPYLSAKLRNAVKSTRLIRLLGRDWR